MLQPDAFASIQYSKMRLDCSQGFAPDPVGELTALPTGPHTPWRALQGRPGGPCPIQNFGWVCHNAFGQTNNRPACSLILFANHRLNGSSSPVLTATCLSYGSLWLSLFFPQPTWRSHPSTDFDAKWLKRRGFTQGRAFWSKIRNFLKPLTPRPPKPPKFAKFWSGLKKFSLDFAFNIGGLTSKHPLFFIGAQ